MVISGLSYLTYSFAFVFINNFVPLISSIKYSQMLQYNTWLLLLDVVVIIAFGRAAICFSPQTFMALMAIGLILWFPISFILLSYASLTKIIIIRIVVIILGTGFSLPLSHLVFNLCDTNNKYLLFGIGYVAGSEAIGKFSNVILLWTWKEYHSFTLLSIYPTIISILAFVILAFEHKAFFLKRKVTY